MAYKEGNRWTAQYYSTDVYGKRKQIKKRGFTTKREALEYERQQKLKKNGMLDMTLATFVEKYFEDKENELKDRSKRNKRYMMQQHIIPYFGKCKMNDISAAQIIEWQNVMYKLGLSDSYLRMIQNQLTALFTHATRIYDLDNNPCKKVKRMGSSDSRSLSFWTIDEYKQFIAVEEQDSKYYLIFEMLFWTGMREGELLALTLDDVNFVTNQIHIDKTYYRMNKKDVVTVPKTEQSIRTIEIPQFLADEIKNYTDRLYGLPRNERIFDIGAKALQNKMLRMIEKSGVKRIRVHDLRHSHVSYLINKGVETLIIKERLGHKDIKITLNTYGHLYPSKQRTVADLLDFEMKKDSDVVSIQSPRIPKDISNEIVSRQFDYSKEIPKIQEKCEEDIENGRTKNVCKRCH